MTEIYIGLMSGTSMDSIDAVCVDFSVQPFKLLATHTEAFPDYIRSDIRAICHPAFDEINQLGQLDRQLGFLFADACNKLLKKTDLDSKEIRAIGSHGQTIRHQPTLTHPFTLQIGDPNIIAEGTGITTISDFRRRDMACGGQGAPLTPAFHQYAFQGENDRMVVNIGGIANITYLPSDVSKPIGGFDSGPGNTLLDSWTHLHLEQDYDCDGKWAADGDVDQTLLTLLLQDPYFQLSPPKSTGKEYFNLNWLAQRIGNMTLTPNGVQSTLAELTARSIINAIDSYKLTSCEILLCGGGVHNKDLFQRLTRQNKNYLVTTTKHYGVDPDWVEAIAFAWLAKQTINHLPGNLPPVTGAKKSTILGTIAPGS